MSLPAFKIANPTLKICHSSHATQHFLEFPAKYTQTRAISFTVGSIERYFKLTFLVALCGNKLVTIYVS